MKRSSIVCLIVSLVLVLGAGLVSAKTELIDDFFDPIDFELGWQYWTPDPENIRLSAELVEETPDGSDFAVKFTADHPDFGFAWMKAVTIKEGAKELRFDIKPIKGTGNLAIHLTDGEGKDFQFHFQVVFQDLEEGWQKVSYKFEESNLYPWDPNLTLADIKFPIGRMNWTFYKCSGIEVLIDNIEVVY